MGDDMNRRTLNSAQSLESGRDGGGKGHDVHTGMTHSIVVS
jgi:hypothetical protein